MKDLKILIFHKMTGFVLVIKRQFFSEQKSNDSNLNFCILNKPATFQENRFISVYVILIINFRNTISRLLLSFNIFSNRFKIF